MTEVLVADSDDSVLETVHRLLRSVGFRVTLAPSGRLALLAARQTEFDLALVDLFLPDLRGEDVVAAMLERRPATRIIAMAESAEVSRRVDVLSRGAVDFVAKPFAGAELVARMRTRLTEIHVGSGDSRFLSRGGIRVDLDRREAHFDGRVVALSHREFVLLTHLMRAGGTTCTREELLERVWGLTFDPGTNVVDVYIRRLRTKLDRNCIETARNVGYRVAAV